MHMDPLSGLASLIWDTTTQMLWILRKGLSSPNGMTNKLRGNTSGGRWKRIIVRMYKYSERDMTAINRFNSITIASACNMAFRCNFLGERSIGIRPGPSTAESNIPLPTGLPSDFQGAGVKWMVETSEERSQSKAARRDASEEGGWRLWV